MTKMTSAYANKLLRQLSDDKDYWVNKENESCLYIAAVGEKPVIPEYDYEEIAATIADIDEKMAAIKHAINLSNTTNQIQAGDQILTVDQILIKTAQLNKRKVFLDRLRKQLPKSRVTEFRYSSRLASPEYQYINYDLDLIKAEFERFSNEIMVYQIALDKYNQTVEFDVEI